MDAEKITALKIIIAKSPAAARRAAHAIQVVQVNSMSANTRYFEAVRAALDDPDASFTAEDRAALAAGYTVEPDETRDYTLRIRLTDRERQALALASETAGMTISEYARQMIFAADDHYQPGSEE